MRSHLLKKTFSFIAAVLLLSGLMLPAHAADLKIAVVNLPYILAKSPQATDARKRMDKDFSARRNRLEAMQKKIVASAEKIKRDSATMSADARVKAEDDMRGQQREFRRLQDEYNEDVSRAEREEMSKIRDVIKEVIGAMVKEKQYDLVLTEGILHASDKVDITELVLKRMDK